MHYSIWYYPWQASRYLWRFSCKLKFLGMRLMVQKHNLESSGTTAIICHKTQNLFLSVIMYWYNLPAVSQVERDRKKVNTLLQSYFPHSLWCSSVYLNTLVHARTVTNRQQKKSSAASASSCSANSLHGSSSSNGSPVVNLQVSWKICWRTRTFEVFYAPGVQIHFMFCCYPASIQITIKRIDSYSVTKFKTDIMQTFIKDTGVEIKEKPQLTYLHWHRFHQRYFSLPPSSHLFLSCQDGRQVSSLCPCPPFQTKHLSFRNWFMTGNTSTHSSSMQCTISNFSLFSKA